MEEHVVEFGGWSLRRMPDRPELDA